jgi:hypothetical protein
MCFARKQLFSLSTATIVAKGECEETFKYIEFGTARSKMSSS